MSTNNTQLVNAWIYMGEDDPIGKDGKVIGYDDPASSYQALIKNNVYQSVDILLICFMTTTPVADGSSYTITVSNVIDKGQHHPNGWTNQDYMNFVIRDAKKNNPKIKIGVTLGWGEADVLTRIFSNTNYTDQQNADNFAANLMNYLKDNKLDGFDIDWESPVCDSTSQDQFKLLINAIGAQFKQQTDKHYYLMLSPDQTLNLDADATNANVDFLNLQLYYSSTLRQDFININVDANLLAYGAEFEGAYQTAQEAYDGFKGTYNVITNWRLNSSDFDFEQSNQQELYRLVHGGS